MRHLRLVGARVECGIYAENSNWNCEFNSSWQHGLAVHATVLLLATKSSSLLEPATNNPSLLTKKQWHNSQMHLSRYESKCTIHLYRTYSLCERRSYRPQIDTAKLNQPDSAKATQ